MINIFSTKTVTAKALAVLTVFSLLAPSMVLATQPVRTCTLVKTTEVVTDLSATLGGTVSCTNYVGQAEQYHVGIIWDDGSTLEEVDITDLVDAGGNLSGNWSAEHTYTTGGVYDVLLDVYHQNTSGNDDGLQTQLVIPDILDYDNGQENTEPLCTDTLDNDNDQLIDAADPDCAPFQDNDTDDDTILNDVDNCPTTPNTDQADNDQDGIGNVCDDTPNGDGGNGNTAPIIAVTGDNPILVFQNAGYVDQGATANDTEDGDMTTSIVTTGLPITTTILGTFEVDYSITDSGGLTATTTRVVNVIEAPFAYGPYCGDGEINQSWEQCDGGVFCTEQCLFPVQESCPLNLSLARINVTDFANGEEGDVTDNLYIGGTDNPIPAGAWFAINENGLPVVDAANINHYKDVPGLAVKRLTNKLRVQLYAFHVGHPGPSQERIAGNVELFGAVNNGWDNVLEATLERPENGLFWNDNLNKGGEDEVWNENNRTHFSLSANTLEDAFIVNHEATTTACVLDPIDEDNGAIIQGRKFNDLNQNGSFDQEEKNASGNPNRLNGWTINLFDTNWNLIDSMVTGGDNTNTNPNHLSGTLDKGQYRFTNLASSTYYVCEQMQEGWYQTGPRATTTEIAIASSTNVTSVTDPESEGDYCYQVVLTDGQEQKNVKFGNTDQAPAPTFLKVHIVKYLNDELAITGPETGYPMEATWNTANLSGGATSSGNYILGNNHGGNPNQYGADTSSMQAPAYYSSHELTTLESEGSPVLPADAQCVEGKYRLVGYSTGNTLEDAEEGAKSTTTPEFYGLNADKYIIVWNEDCEDLPQPNQPPTITILGTNPFNLILNNPFVDPGATSTDPEDGNITANIATSTNLNINVIGTYYFVYSVADSDSAMAYATRTITVVAAAPEEETPPGSGGGGSGGSGGGGGGGGGSSGGCTPGFPCSFGGGGSPNTGSGGNGGTGGSNPTLALITAPNLGQGGSEIGQGGDEDLALGDSSTTTTSTSTENTPSSTTTGNNQVAAVGFLGSLFGISWWWWILILIALGIITYYIFRDRDQT